MKANWPLVSYLFPILGNLPGLQDAVNLVGDETLPHGAYTSLQAMERQGRVAAPRGDPVRPLARGLNATHMGVYVVIVATRSSHSISKPKDLSCGQQVAQ